MRRKAKVTERTDRARRNRENEEERQARHTSPTIVTIFDIGYRGHANKHVLTIDTGVYSIYVLTLLLRVN